MQTLKDWQWNRAYRMKGAITLCRASLFNLPRNWLTLKEERAITNAVAHIDVLLKEYDKNTKKMRPE